MQFRNPEQGNKVQNQNTELTNKLADLLRKADRSDLAEKVVEGKQVFLADELNDLNKSSSDSSQTVIDDFPTFKAKRASAKNPSSYIEPKHGDDDSQ